MGYVLEGFVFSVITEKYEITRIKKNLKLKCKVELLSFNMLKMSGKTTYVQVNSTDEPATMRASVVNCSGNSGSQKVELYKREEETQYLKNLKAIIGENNVTISSIQKAYMLKEYNKQTYISKNHKTNQYTYKGTINKIDELYTKNDNTYTYTDKCTAFSIYLFNNTEAKFDTFFQVEDKFFVEATNEKVKGNNYLIVGPLKEIYNGGDLKKLNTKYKLESGEITDLQVNTEIISKGDPLQAIKITSDIFNKMIASNLFKYRNANKEKGESGDNVIEFFTLYGGENWGSSHVLQVDDWLMVNGTEFYRIYSKAWKATYDVVDKDNNKIDSVVGGRKSKKSIKYIRTDDRYGKNIVYTTSRGGKYIKNKNGDYEKITMKKH